jgi:hypothetical protein
MDRFDFASVLEIEFIAEASRLDSESILTFDLIDEREDGCLKVDDAEKAFTEVNASGARRRCCGFILFLDVDLENV